VPWHSPSNFFSSPSDARAAGFLADAELVWELLDGIGPFVSSILRPNVAPLREIQGGLVPRPAAIMDGKAIPDGITYDLKPPDGGFRVYLEGKELPGAALVLPGAFLASDDIELGPGALVESGAWIAGPTLIGSGAAVRQGAYVRGSVLAMEGAMIGHATEAKNVVMLDGARAGHFAYLGDSILGNGVNLGAGTKLANLKMTSLPYRFKVGGKVTEVLRRKFGAVLGDGVETGCNSVANPGTLMGMNCRVMPNASVRAGYHDHMTVVK
jgi:carbonic anhydrase/acetyltransferase-like protein (isoleucine patch superfamily)